MRNKTFLLFIFISAIHATGIAQQDKITDSLLNVLKTQKEDTSKVNVLNSISRQIRFSGFNYSRRFYNALKYGEDALTLAKKINFKRGMATAYENIGRAHNANRNYSEALKNKVASLQLRLEIGNKQEIARGHFDIGLTYHASGDFPEALTSVFASLKISQEICDNEQIYQCYVSIATLNGLQGNYPESLKYYLAMLKTAEGIGDKTKIVWVNMRMGDFFRDLGNLQQALKYYLIGNKIIEEMGNNPAGSLSSIGYVYYLQGKYPEAMKYYLSALKSETNQRNISEHYVLIAQVFLAQSNFAEALKYLRLKLTTDEKIRDTSTIIVTYRRIGALYVDWAGQIRNVDSLVYREQLFSEAVKNFFESLRISEESGSMPTISHSYADIGNVYRLQRKFSEALKNYFAALKINKELGQKQHIAWYSLDIADIYIELKKFPEAREFFNDALSISRESGDKIMIKNSYDRLTTLDIASDNWEGAYYNNKMFTLYRDSLENEKNSKKITEMMMRFEFDKKEDSLKLQQAYTDQELMSQTLLTRQQQQALLLKEKEFTLMNNEKQLQQLQFEKHQADFTSQKIAQKADADTKQGQLSLLNKEKAIQTLELNKQTSLKNYLLAGIVLLGILSFFVYKNYRTRQKLNLQTLRNKIASDLHDDVGSTLSSISIFSQMAQEQSKEVNPLLDTIGESSRKMLDAMADIVWTINPENDQFEKIILRMRSFAFELLGAKNIDFEFNADEEATKMKLSMEVRKNLYLIFKEATNNLVKYSGANKAAFNIKAEKNNLCMMIRDNGKGFDQLQATMGNGLKNMKKRAEEIRAQFMILSTPGNGTTLELKIAV